MNRILIHGGTCLDPATNTAGTRDILVERGRIRAVERGLAKRLARSQNISKLEANGAWVIPGAVDMHVHLRYPGPGNDETISTGTNAAARGGVTTVVAMANTRPTVDSPARVRQVISRARKDASVNVLVAAAVTRGLLGKRINELEKIAAAGAIAFSDDGMPVMNSGIMLRAMQRARALGMPILDHAEDLGLTGDGAIREGARSKMLRVPGIHPATEPLMAMRDIELARITGARLHLCHVSSARTVALVRRAKREGINVTAEAAPHHFILIDGDIPAPCRYGGCAPCDTDFKMKPPLMSSADRRAIQEGLIDGAIDAVATDHAPHPKRSKAKGLKKAPFGVIGLETSLPLSLSLVKKGGLTPLRWVERISTNPARILGLKGKGTLRPGSDADITVFDPNARWRLDSNFTSKSANSPFLGRRLRGRARHTIVNGRVVYSWRNA